MQKSRKSQISTEYLIILAVSLAVILPAGYFFYSYSQTSNDESVRLQINQIGQEIMDNAEKIYGLSEGSLVSIDLKYPQNTRAIYVIENYEMTILYELSTGPTEAVFFSKVPLTGPYDLNLVPCASLPCSNSTFYNLTAQPGTHSLKMESRTNYVLITQLT